ncbi:Hypothetical protein SRAE_1000306900 [Strongyloides ratti]|uniref:Uncharacterized protein n=1 Tax=Strongyloides ratti TaxID=34506 RepID=A0A090L4U2_STRRB|nr:Hypothetical protein SRAE_1000306900 [Strongyloides ratti]CEF64816.2 Hypothetical protein SRAE_1000306900 [Strongyloides ratti]
MYHSPLHSYFFCVYYNVNWLYKNNMSTTNHQLNILSWKNEDTKKLLNSFTTEFDYSNYSLTDQNTTMVTLGLEGVEKEKMKYFDEITRENLLFINKNESFIDREKKSSTERENFFYDSSYDILSYDSYYQSQSLQTFLFY